LTDIFSGVDNVVEMNVVTSTGQYLTVNSHRYSDLFWALRGGGGGTYGVLTSATYQTHPSVPFSAVFFNSTSSNIITMRKLFREFIRIHPVLSDTRFGGYGTVTNTSFYWLLAVSNGSETTTNQSINPFFEYAQNLTSEGLDITVATTVSYDSFYSFYQKFFATALDIEGGIAEIASRLVPRELFENDYERLADTLFDVDGGVSWKYVPQPFRGVSLCS
jgi:hypothetical protein